MDFNKLYSTSFYQEMSDNLHIRVRNGISCNSSFTNFEVKVAEKCILSEIKTLQHLKQLKRGFL
jgi:hypothetical protein